MAQSYFDFLKIDLNALLDALDITDLHKHFLRSRWLDQVLYLEKQAQSSQQKYYFFRMTTIIGGVTIPALVSLNLGNLEIQKYVQPLTFAISLLVAISSAVEGFFRYGDRWRHYRQTAESQKIEGWEFFQLSGPYRRFGNHLEAYTSFANRVEDIVRRDVAVYVADITQEKKSEEKEKQEEAKDRQNDSK